jgi:hypothetical protein
MSNPSYPSSRHDRPHARIYDHWLRHPAWKNLSPPAFKIITTLLASYRPEKNNVFLVGERRIADLCPCSPRTARFAIDELIEGGFLRVERKGRSDGAVSARERAVSLTRYNTDTLVGDPELPMRVWETQRHNKLIAETPRKGCV